MSPLLRIVLGLLAAYLLVGLFYARLEDDAHTALRKDATSKDVVKKRLIREKHEQDSVAERRHNELVGALRMQRQSTAGFSTTLAEPAAEQAAASPAATTGSAAPATRPVAPVPVASTARSVASAPDRLRASLAWLLPALALLGGALLVGFAWLGWRERQIRLLVPDRFERDTPLLELLLRTFAGSIGRVLPIPRQVKRFASKARLQHNLLHTLAKNGQSQTAAHPPFQSTDQRFTPTSFGPHEQVLAILLLLLLEEEILRESRFKLEHLTDDAAVVYLRETDQDEFASKLRTLFAAWHDAGSDEEVYAQFRQLAGPSVPAYEELPELLDGKAGDWLLMQLHRLNAGLLV